jgi:hypothetical protein
MSIWSWKKSLLLLGFCVLGTAGWEARAQDEAVAENEGSERGEAERDDPGARLAWEVEYSGQVTAATRANEVRQINLHNAKKNAPGQKWVNIGPSNADYEQNGSFTGHVRDSGRARGILFHPDYPDTVFFLNSGGGLWRTDNWSANTPTWTALTDNISTTGGGAVDFGRSPNTLYLGLGDPYDQLLIGGAVVKSKNGGVSWGPTVELGTTISVRDLKVDTSMPNDIVLVATENGLFRSIDEGASFSQVPTFAGLSVWSIVRSSAGWLATAQTCAAPLGSRIGVICGTNLTLYLSTDKGATWAPISNAGNVFNSNGRTTLAVAKPGESVVYAYSSNIGETILRDVYRSADGGQTWVSTGTTTTKAPTNPVTGASTQLNMNICGGQCWYNQSIGVDPNDPTRNTVWIGGNLGTASSTDGGITWTIRTWWLYSQDPTLPYAHADHHMLAFKTTGTPTIVLGNDGGLNVSTDNGETFTSDKNVGLISHLFYTISGNDKFPNLVIGGLQDNGTRVRTDNGGTYNQSSGGDGLGTAYSLDNTNSVFASAASSTVPSLRVNMSNNAPTEIQNFVSATSGFSDGTGSGFFTNIVPAPTGLDATGKVFFTFSNARIWKTTTSGLSSGTCTVVNQPGCGWKWIASAGVGGILSTRRFRSTPYNLGVSPTDINRIAAGASSGFIDVTTNGGAAWTDINVIGLVPGFTGFISNVIWQDNQNIWITSADLNPGAKRVIKASIATPATPWTAATFTVLQNGLPDLPVSRLYFDPRDVTHNTIYAATHVGIYRTTNGGSSWAPFGNGLPTVRVNDIYMPRDGSTMRIATYGRGIWELAQIELEKASLADNVTSCDHDGVLDNGEVGTLQITLRNQGPNNVNKGTLTFTSDNPHVTFPKGNVVPVPPLGKGASGSAGVAVALSNASGIEKVTFTVAIDAPELAAATPYTVTTSYRLNYDEVPNASATETFEESNPNWSIVGDPANQPNILNWQRRALAFDDHVAYGPDNNGQEDDTKGTMPDDQYLISPVLSVGPGAALGVSFRHRFFFESGNWDGGVIELSSDGGATWVDIGVGKYNGVTLNSPPNVTDSHLGAGRPAFVGRMTSTANPVWPAFANVTLNPVVGYSNQNVLVRFNIGADSGNGAPGWDVDDITFTGITNTPFTALVPNAGVCTP